MTTLTVGTNDAADNTGDLIVSFVDAVPAGTLTTDGTRSVLPNVNAPASSIGVTDTGAVGGTVQIVLAGSGQSITDSSGNVWTIDPGNGGQVFENGALPNGQFSSNVAKIAYVGGIIYHENNSNQWYQWTGTAWSATTDPTTGGAWTNHYAFGGNEYTLPFNNELQYYGSSSRTPGFNPITTQNGVLSITANSVANTVSNPLSLPYNSGAMITATETNGVPTQGLFSFTTGFVAARLLLPKGQGLWPAFWLEPQPFPTTGVEIDIMEALGRDTTTVFCTTHQSGGTQTAVKVSDYSVNYHEYAIDVQTDFLTWYIDGVQVKQATSDATVLELKYVLMNLAIASATSWDGSAGVGPPNASTSFPASMLCTYIRAAASKAAYSAGAFTNLLPTATAVGNPTAGTYLIAPSISPQTGCVVTMSSTTAQWESCSLIWQPPPHAATLWTSGGAFTGSGGAAANPKFPPQSASGAGETDATASVSGRMRAQAAAGASLSAAAGISARALVRGISAGALAGAGGVSTDFTIRHPGGTLWFSGGLTAAGGGISSRANQKWSFAASVGGAAGISGDATRATVGQQYLLSGSINGAGSISGNPWIGHQYFVSGKPAGSATITFSPTTPLRVTNWVRNPRPEGVTAGFVDGTSNTGPTDWWLLFANPDSMLAVTMIGTGTEGIIPYVDIRWNNASCPGGFQTVQTDGGIIVNSGVVWSYSVFCRLVGGSLTNISSIGLQILTDGTTGFFNGPTITPTSASLASQWSHWDGVNVTDSGMTNIAAGLVINANAGAVDLTLRIGAPKAEKATTASASQFQAIPQIGFVPPQGGSSSFVY